MTVLITLVAAAIFIAAVYLLSNAPKFIFGSAQTLGSAKKWLPKIHLPKSQYVRLFLATTAIGIALLWILFPGLREYLASQKILVVAFVFGGFALYLLSDRKTQITQRIVRILGLVAILASLGFLIYNYSGYIPGERFVANKLASHYLPVKNFELSNQKPLLQGKRYRYEVVARRASPTPTEISVREGDVLIIKAEGRIFWDKYIDTHDEWVGPNGSVWKGKNAFRPSSFLVPEKGMAALLGVIDGHKPFFIGDGRVLEITKSGTLSLFINERQYPRFFEDNDGSFKVDIVHVPSGTF